MSRSHPGKAGFCEPSSDSPGEGADHRGMQVPSRDESCPCRSFGPMGSWASQKMIQGQMQKREGGREHPNGTAALVSLLGTQELVCHPQGFQLF